MPMFYFNFEDCRDDTGVALFDIEAAKRCAVQLIAKTLCHQPMKFWEAETYRVTVTDEEGLYLFVVEVLATLSPAISPRAAAVRS